MGDTPSRFVRALTPTELEELARLRRERPRTLGFPAEAVLMSARRLPIPEIMRRLGVSRPTVTGWLTRFERSGMSGLAPRPRSGRPPKLTSDVLRHIGRRFPASRARDEWGGLDPPHTQGVSGESRRRVRALSRESLRVALLRKVRGDVGPALENRGF